MPANPNQQQLIQSHTYNQDAVEQQILAEMQRALAAGDYHAFAKAYPKIATLPQHSGMTMQRFAPALADAQQRWPGIFLNESADSFGGLFGFMRKYGPMAVKGAALTGIGIGAAGLFGAGAAGAGGAAGGGAGAGGASGAASAAGGAAGAADVGAGLPSIWGSFAGGTAGGAGAAGAAAAATPWWGTFGGQTAINTGLNLLGGYMNNQAIGAAQSNEQKAIASRIRQALAELAPEHIMAMAQHFLPQMAANASAANQTGISAIREQAARTGQLEGPRELSVEAGARNAMSNQVQQNAFTAAFNNAGTRSSAITGAPYVNYQPLGGIGQAITNSANQAYFTRAMTQKPAGNVPYTYPGMGPYGSQPNWPAMSQQQPAGVPYRYGPW